LQSSVSKGIAGKGLAPMGCCRVPVSMARRRRPPISTARCRGPVFRARRREAAHLHRSLQEPRLHGAPPGGSPSPPLAAGACLHGAPPGVRSSPSRAAGRTSTSPRRWSSLPWFPQVLLVKFFELGCTTFWSFFTFRIMTPVDVIYFFFLHRGSSFFPFSTFRILKIVGSSISGCNISMFPQDLDVFFSLFLHSIAANFYRKKRRWPILLFFIFFFCLDLQSTYVDVFFICDQNICTGREGAREEKCADLTFYFWNVRAV
jgi:hypothetical protein